MLEHVIFDSLEIENKIFVNRVYETGKNNTGEVRLYCFCVYKGDFGWYYFERANTTRRGIHYFKDLIDLQIFHLENMSYQRLLTEISEIPVGYSLSEFNEYVNSFKEIAGGRKY